MSTFDNIIGYSSVRKELMQLDGIEKTFGLRKRHACKKALLSDVDIAKIRSECKLVVSLLLAGVVNKYQANAKRTSQDFQMTPRIKHDKNISRAE